MRKGMIFFTIVVFALTLAMPAWGAEAQPGAGKQQTLQLPKLDCYIEGNVKGQKIMNGSTIDCPMSEPVYLYLYVKNFGSVEYQGLHIGAIGNIRTPKLTEIPAPSSDLPAAHLSCGGLGNPPCPPPWYKRTYENIPFSSSVSGSNLKPGNAVQVYSTQVKQDCTTRINQAQQSELFPVEVGMSATIELGRPGLIDNPGCHYKIQINRINN